MAILGLDTRVKQGIFLSYMGLWSALRLITYGSKQGGNAPKYNETSLLVFVCVAKLIIAGSMYLRADGNFEEMVLQFKGNLGLCARYFLPALSYVVYDNLTFVNLTYTDPVTYVILMQMRIALTGLMWSLFFGKTLNRNQWVAIVLLTLACVLQKGGDFFWPSSDKHGADTSKAASLFSVGLIGLQILFGVFSSVFNELLLKEKGSAGVNLQNMFMYTNSIFCNLAWLLFCPSKALCKGDLFEAMSFENLGMLLDVRVLPIGVILATIGIVTSLFIKYLDSVRKTIASALELFVDAVLTWLIFGIPIGWPTLSAIILASAGVVIYSRPVVDPVEKVPEGSV